MTLPQLARLLGFLGLLPFLVLSVGTWIPLPYISDPHAVLMAYAAVILSFMGAIHWGVAMSRHTTGENLQLGLSVLPALLGWLALLLPGLYGYGLLLVGFAALYGADRCASDRGLLPAWYLPMRLVLTTIVLLCLAAAAAATGMRRIVF